MLSRNKICWRYLLTLCWWWWGGVASIARAAARAGGSFSPLWLHSSDVTTAAAGFAQCSRSKYKVRMWPGGSRAGEGQRGGRQDDDGEHRAEGAGDLGCWCYPPGVWEQCQGGDFLPIWYSVVVTSSEGGLSAKRGGAYGRAESNCHLVTGYLTATPANVIVVDTHMPQIDLWFVYWQIPFLPPPI